MYAIVLFLLEQNSTNKTTVEREIHVHTFTFLFLYLSRSKKFCRMLRPVLYVDGCSPLLHLSIANQYIQKLIVWQKRTN